MFWLDIFMKKWLMASALSVLFRWNSTQILRNVPLKSTSCSIAKEEHRICSGCAGIEMALQNICNPRSEMLGHRSPLFLQFHALRNTLEICSFMVFPNFWRQIEWYNDTFSNRFMCKPIYTSMEPLKTQRDMMCSPLWVELVRYAEFVLFAHATSDCWFEQWRLNDKSWIDIKTIQVQKRA